MKSLLPLLLPVVAAVGHSACDDSRDPPADVIWQSDHFQYRARAADGAACVTTLDVMEKHFALMHEYLGFLWPAGQRIPYYKFIDLADSLSNAGCAARGACAVGASVRSHKAFHEHELIHAYLAPSGSPPSVLQEGIAVVMACDVVDDAMPKLSWDEAVLSNDPVHEESIYDTGARWVHYLLRRYGTELFLQLYTTLPHAASPSEVDSAITRIYGVSAGDTWNEALASPPACLPLWACSRPAISTDGVPITAGGHCGFEQDGRTFALPGDGNVLVATSALVPFRLLACDDGQPPIGVLLPNAGITFSPQRALTALGAGRYALEFPNSPSTLTVTVPAIPWAGPDCATLMALEIAANDFSALRIVPPRGQTEWTVSLRIAGPHLLAVRGDTGVAASICADCDFGAVGCEPTSQTDVLWNGDYRLSINRSSSAVVSPSGIDILGR